MSETKEYVLDSYGVASYATSRDVADDFGICHTIEKRCLLKEGTRNNRYESPVDRSKNLVAQVVVASDRINTTSGIFESVRQSFIHRYY
ncbi:hypothetical protein NPIL_587131 [Nephila pilipes]|uniref:Uncharacterized protein n=1 Tax=Nephila pilipes TaxID=299642 RepID=A0A8X6NLJ7_NEPPI|nr:hypothetical protein NPIL_587131 [Nephila pilipes]